MLLHLLTWSTTSTYKDVIDGITTDPVPPAHIIPRDGLNPKVYNQVSKETRMTNEPAVPGPLVRTSKTTYSHDYTFRLVREGGCRVSQGAPIAACSVNKHSSNSSNKTGCLKSPVSWDTAGDDKVLDQRPHIHVRRSAKQSKRS
jgi:hypothetical protein